MWPFPPILALSLNCSCWVLSHESRSFALYHPYSTAAFGDAPAKFIGVQIEN